MESHPGKKDLSGSKAIRAHCDGIDRPVQNFGDGLGIHILHALGFRCVRTHEDTRDVVNPGRCFCSTGSLLTGESIQKFTCPVDIWGSGWKGRDRWQFVEANMKVHAVRGPLTAEGLGMPEETPLGDPGLLVPWLFPIEAQKHQKSILMQHLFRIGSPMADRAAPAAGCDEVLTSLVYASMNRNSLSLIGLRGVLTNAWQWSIYRKTTIHSVWDLLAKIAGASFVLTGSLHGAVLAQAFGVPWAAYTDGYVDAPPKWADWGAYLGIEIEFVRRRKEADEWWNEVGRHARLRSLRPLVEAFPYIEHSPRAQELAKVID
jgi:hypothetical protein